MVLCKRDSHFLIHLNKFYSLESIPCIINPADINQSHIHLHMFPSFLSIAKEGSSLSNLSLKHLSMYHSSHGNYHKHRFLKKKKKSPNKNNGKEEKETIKFGKVAVTIIFDVS